ncbi:hypothetical protein C1645_827355 [Glomus cerebriforme]|uniref:Uncharacterized protein n=1 Tax=Glomus cerebriforme TaxID=658196 RepID=A0A397SUP4_9GLOM|nr:hypothetical protein C1645_827355 [Glomus cerebriforme]
MLISTIQRKWYYLNRKKILAQDSVPLSRESTTPYDPTPPQNPTPPHDPTSPCDPTLPRTRRRAKNNVIIY